MQRILKVEVLKELEERVGVERKNSSCNLERIDEELRLVKLKLRDDATNFWRRGVKAMKSS